MQQSGRTYIAIDLKAFYASVECMERGLDPLTTNLVVADASRTEKTICLAVSPSLKAHGISGRARLFEVVARVKEVNAERRRKAGCLSEKSFNANELAADSSREVDYLIAPPRMAKYIQISTQVYNVYLKYIAPEDIHVYSIDEVMMDVTNYLQTYRMTARELAKVMISTSCTPRASQPRQASAAISISARSLWTLWGSTCSRTKTASALRSLTK